MRKKKKKKKAVKALHDLITLTGVKEIEIEIYKKKNGKI